MTEEPVGYSQWGRQELDMTEWAHALHIKHLLFTWLEKEMATHSSILA